MRSSSVKMGNSIEQHRSAIGSFNARKNNKKEGPDLFWVSLRDLVLVVVTLQLLFLGILALQCNLSLHASLDADVLIFSPVAGKVRANLRCVCLCVWGRRVLSIHSLFVLQVIEKLRDVREKQAFSVVKRKLLLREGVERNPGPASIGQTLEWYKTTLQNGKVSEAKIKSEALRFFKLSKSNELKDKKLFNLLRETMKSRNGKGSHCEIPPDYFATEFSCEKQRKSLFAKMCREDVKIGARYLNWIDQDFHLFEDCEQITKLDTEPEKVEDTMKVTRERSSGPNIFDVSRTIVSMNVDGTVKKTVKNQTYANISIREKRKIGDSGECEITGAGVRKRAKLVYNLLNHASENNPKTKGGSKNRFP